MPRISLWKPQKGYDFRFADKAIGESFRIGGDGILIHMYEGPTIDSKGSKETTLTTIQDVLFLENTTRKYNPDVIELRGHHIHTDTSYDLSQFGIFLSSDVVKFQFHYNDMLDAVGRKLIAGDVLELPSMRDTPIFDNAVGINKFYVVQEGVYAAAGYGNSWLPHIWTVKAKEMTASPEFSEIIAQNAQGQSAGGLGQGMGMMPDGFTETMDANGNPGIGCNPNIKNSMDLFCKIIDISDKVTAEAAENVFFDPLYFESDNLYIYIDPETNYPIIGSYIYSGSDVPPNGGPLLGAGITFPETMKDGDYYLRVDYTPERLFQKQGKVYKLIEVNVLKRWTAYNKILDTFIDNNKDTLLSNGDIIPEKQAVSQVVKQKVDLYAERKKRTTAEAAIHDKIANARAEKKGN